MYNIFPKGRRKMVLGEFINILINIIVWLVGTIFIFIANYVFRYNFFWSSIFLSIGASILASAIVLTIDLVKSLPAWDKLFQLRRIFLSMVLGKFTKKGTWINMIS